jgi:hypothetical protein
MVSEVLQESALISPLDHGFPSEKRVRGRKLVAEVPGTWLLISIANSASSLWRLHTM